MQAQVQVCAQEGLEMRRIGNGKQKNDERMDEHGWCDELLLVCKSTGLMFRGTCTLSRAGFRAPSEDARRRKCPL